LTKLRTSSSNTTYQRVGRGEDPADRFGAGRGLHRRSAERLDTLIAGDLAGEIDPRRLVLGLRVPGIADKHANACCRRRRQAGLAEELRYPRKAGGAGAGIGKVVECGEGMRLAAAELGDQRQDRRGIVRFAG
jgi:hypothetical protein